MTDQITYFFEDITKPPLTFDQTSQWILRAISLENKVLQHLNYIFCSDEYLRNINVEYLNHDYYTDIITFDNSETDIDIEGDIFISLDRIKENAQTLETQYSEELKRVIIHGLLHLIGYNDKTNIDKKHMREKENTYLSLSNFKI